MNKNAYYAIIFWTTATIMKYRKIIDAGFASPKY